MVSSAILFEEKKEWSPKKYFRMAISVAFSSPAAKSLLLHLTHLEYACRAALRKMDPPPRSPLCPDPAQSRSVPTVFTDQRGREGKGWKEEDGWQRRIPLSALGGGGGDR